MTRWWLAVLRFFEPGRCGWCRTRLDDAGARYCGDDCREAHATEPAGW